MTTPNLARQLLLHEARGLLSRLGQVQPFATTMPATPAASVPQDAQLVMEQHMSVVKKRLRVLIHRFIAWLSAAPPGQSMTEAQKRYVILKLQFNAMITQFDIFADVLGQRAQHVIGNWIAGLDDFAADAMRVRGMKLDLPPVVIYLDRGHGAAIRRVRSKLPGGDLNPVAVISIPRERMVGSGIASSLVHEVGHQVASILELVESLQPLLAREERRDPSNRQAWFAWRHWISEILADLWSVGQLGVGATTGLMSVVSLPVPFMFRADLEDPHPAPWIRVKLSIALGKYLYPDTQWSALDRVWETLYPPQALVGAVPGLLSSLLKTIPRLSELMLTHRPPKLVGKRVIDVIPTQIRTPARLRAWFQSNRNQWSEWLQLQPTQAMAVLGQARLDRSISTESETHILKRLLNEWALRSAVSRSHRCRQLLQTTGAAPEAALALA